MNFLSFPLVIFFNFEHFEILKLPFTYYLLKNSVGAIQFNGKNKKSRDIVETVWTTPYFFPCKMLVKIIFTR